ncbi:MAG TPA: hypothetical protein DDW50_07695, partial [Firmicutes bacterium]|nr:hypothetical protein [Bacillota bacterium]
MITSQYKYGLKPDRQDPRDYIYKPAIAKVPKRVDLRPHFPAVYDQGQLGSCTANAGVGLREYLEIISAMGATAQCSLSQMEPKECLEYISNLRRVFDQKYVPLSRLFLYWHTRSIEGTVDEDSGASLDDCMKVMKNIGICPEVDFPYDIGKFKDPPSE